MVQLQPQTIHRITQQAFHVYGPSQLRKDITYS